VSEEVGGENLRGQALIKKHKVSVTKLARHCVLWALGAVLVCSFAPSARAGIYDVAQCQPGKTARSAAVFEASSTHFREAKACAGQNSNGLVIVHAAAQTRGGRYGQWTFRAPAGTLFAATKFSANIQRQDGVEATFIASASGVTPYEFGVTQNGTWIAASSGPREAQQLILRLVCRRAPDQVCGRAESAHLWARYFRFTLNDTSAPSFVLGGSLFVGGALHGDQTVAISGGDAGGGVRRVQVNVNGLGAATDTVPCALSGGLGTTLSPCPSDVQRTLTIDTAAAPFRDGTNLVQVCVSDFATSRTPPNTVCEERSVEVDNSCPESPVAGGTELGARFARNRKQTIKIAAGKRALIRGHLTSASGRPVAGALVCAKTRVKRRGSGFQFSRAAITDSSGQFAIRLPRGPSREVIIGYRVGAVEIDRRLRLLARPHPRLRVRPHRLLNGQRITMRGRIPRPFPRHRIVVIQGRNPGERRWITFEKARTDASGKFRARYTFLRVTSGIARFKIRALIPAQSGYPYASGRSSARTVVVIGHT
jgi:hypothetical protein